MLRHLRVALALAFAVLLAPVHALAQGAGAEVDLELILAADVSGSMDAEEAALQRKGYLDALTDPRVIRAIQSGPKGRVAIAYLEWAGPHWQKVIANWIVVHDAVSAHAFASAIAESPVVTERRTSISAALDYAAVMFAKNPYKGARRVIDVSGDGPNNRGRDIALARAEALAQGITINGLPIVNDRPNPWGGFGGGGYGGRRIDLEAYYRDQVIGGPGAFVIPALTFQNFGQAILAKLIREIAGLPGPVQAQAAEILDADAARLNGAR